MLMPCEAPSVGSSPLHFLCFQQHLRLFFSGLDAVTSQLSQVARVSGIWPMIVWLLEGGEWKTSFTLKLGQLTLQSSPGLLPEITPCLAAPSSFPAFSIFLMVSLGSFSLTNHSHANPHLSVSSKKDNLRHIRGCIHWYTNVHTNYGYAPKMWLRNPYYPLPTSIGSEHT